MLLTELTQAGELKWLLRERPLVREGTLAAGGSLTASSQLRCLVIKYLIISHLSVFSVKKSLPFTLH